jgi:hypothetical protein
MAISNLKLHLVLVGHSMIHINQLLGGITLFFFFSFFWGMSHIDQGFWKFGQTIWDKSEVLLGTYSGNSLRTWGTS